MKIMVEPNLANVKIPEGRLNVKLTYPYSDEYEYHTQLKRIDLDKERINDLKTGKGFIIQSTRSLRNDVKNQMGIFSNRFGSTIDDVDSFNGKYRCRCGLTRGSIMHGEICPSCRTIVKFYDDDVSIFGWLLLKNDYFVIHPNIYRTLEGFIGAIRLQDIIKPIINVDSDGKIISIGEGSSKEPFKGIGLFDFRDRYDEILNFYLSKYPAKKYFYDDLISNKDITFVHSIPVFSALLRPSVLENGSILRYQSVNESFQMLTRLVNECNKDKLRMNRKLKEKVNILFDIQMQFNQVYVRLRDCMAKKKGDIRLSVAGRYSFTSRSVIKQDVHLHSNEIRLPFNGLLELLQQVIINILVKTHNMSYSDAYKYWRKCQYKGYDQTIYDIIDGLIKDHGGLPIVITVCPILE